MNPFWGQVHSITSIRCMSQEKIMKGVKSQISESVFLKGCPNIQCSSTNQMLEIRETWMVPLYLDYWLTRQ